MSVDPKNDVLWKLSPWEFYAVWDFRGWLFSIMTSNEEDDGDLYRNTDTD
jgi:hypothetical protein